MINYQLPMINNKFRPYLFQLAYVVIGLIVLVSVSWFSKNLDINPTILTLILFLIGYVCLAYFLKVLPSLKAYWSLKKIYLLVIGYVAGIIIQAIPILLTQSIPLSKAMFLFSFYQIAIFSIFFTFFTVLWEELWFRNPILNLAESKNQKILLSVFTGLLFALLHLMNPKINLLHDGLELFLAGVLLTISYYASKSFWLPLGLHFGNNIFSRLIEKMNFDTAGVGITNELVLRWVVLAISIGITFLYWPKMKKDTV